MVEGIVLALFVLAVVLMTYPITFRSEAGLPSLGLDIFAAHWQKWWLGQVLKNGYDPNFTPYLFHPTGLDVTFQSHPWTALGTWQLLSSQYGDAAGYNLNLMLGLLLSAYGTYLLIRQLTGSRMAAWIGGAFYAFYPAHVIRVLRQPNTGSIQWIPIFMVLLIKGLRRVAASPQHPRVLPPHGLLTISAAAVALSLNAYITMKPWMQAVLIGALYVPMASLAHGWWRSAAFWKALGVLIFCSLLLVLPILSPYLLAGSGLHYAIEQHADQLATAGVDLVAFVRAAPELPAFMPRSLARLAGFSFTKWVKGDSFYLGLTSIVLVAFGLLGSAKLDRQCVVWLAIALIFWGLSLGTVLWIDQVKHPGIWMPYRLVADNPIFKTVRIPHRFALGFSLAWAVLVGYGVATILRRLATTKWLARGLVSCIAVLMLIELTEAPITLHPTNVSPFYYELRGASERGAIIDLPMGGQPSKRYMYLQTIHGRPIVEGKAARMPIDAYDYIDANPLLHAWSVYDPPLCDYDIGQAISDLNADGFRYVILHNTPDLEPEIQRMAAYFLVVEPIYSDEWISVYGLSDLAQHSPCS